MRSWIFSQMEFSFVPLIISVLLWTNVSSTEDERKNHRAEKRQDDSFLFFGGWRPVKAGNKYYQSSASSPFHEILRAVPTNFDPAASHYAQAMSSQYHKDIFNFYPKPVIKSKPKKNTPVYMERYRPQRQPQKQYPVGGPNHPYQILDLPEIDLKQIHDLQELILHSKELPFSQFSQINLPIERVKPLDIVEVSLQSLQQGNQKYGYPRNNGNDGFKNLPQSSKPSYNQVRHQSRATGKPPVQYKYISVPKGHSNLLSGLPKELEITPIKLQHPLHSIGDVVDLKNVQIVEVPVPQISTYLNSGHDSGYGKTHSQQNHQLYQTSSQNTHSKKGFPSISYFAHQSEQPRKHHEPPQQKHNQAHQQPSLEAELIKLNEGELKNLLSSLQILTKNPQELLKHFPLNQIGSLDNIHLLLPQADSGYESSKAAQSNSAYGNAEQYSVQSDASSYQSKGTSNYGQSSNGYQSDTHGNSASGYESGHPSPRNIGGGYDGNNYHQHGNSNSGYDKVNSYRNNQEVKYSSGQDQYPQTDHGISHSHGGSYGQQEQSYIQVLTPPAGEDGYRREPVLAVEIQQGQSIEEAIKSIDPETLHKLGSHGKNGIEIEVVEIPVDEYASESKKTETVVSPGNSTVPLKPKKTTSIS